MLNIKKNLEDEIKLYCKLNNIEDVDLFANNLLNTAFVVEKYGDKPNLDIIVNKNIEIKLDVIDENSVSLPNQIQKVEEEPIEPEVKKEDTGIIESSLLGITNINFNINTFVKITKTKNFHSTSNFLTNYIA
jgi:hypothetical protein